MFSIGALGAGRDVGFVARFWMGHGVARRPHLSGGGSRGHECGTTEMAAFAIGVTGTRGVVSAIRGRADFIAALVLVLMVAEVLLRRDAVFVRAVRRRRAPDQLERHNKQQEREHPTAHVSDSRLVGRPRPAARGPRPAAPAGQTAALGVSASSAASRPERMATTKAASALASQGYRGMPRRETAASRRRD